MAKSGRSLEALAAEITRQHESKHDFIVRADKLQMMEDGELLIPTQQPVALTALAHDQMAEYASIPTAYYRRMLTEAPELLARNVNRWVQEPPAEGKQADRRTVRMLDGKIRAFLSDKYRPLDNFDLAEAVLPVLLERRLLILSCEITETRMYIKAVDRTIERDVPTGKYMGDGGHTIFDTCCPGITISNSEVGHGALSISATVWTRACTNLADFGASIRKFHTGKRAELSEEIYALLTDETKAKTDAAVWAQTKDLVIAAFDTAKFEAQCKRLGATAADKLEPTKVPDVVEVVGKKFALNETERTGILGRLIDGRDFTRYGLHAAVTNYSQESMLSYDRSTELERVGGKLIDLSKSEWETLAAAA